MSKKEHKPYSSDLNALDKSAKVFMEKYINNNAPTSYETPGQELWLDYLKDFVDEIHTDNYGTAYGVINPGQDYKVVIEAHADEISWFIHYIGDDGMLYVSRNGGSDPAIAPSMRVDVHLRGGGKVQGVFGWPAIHLRKAKDDIKPSLDTIFIDVGAKSKDEVLEMGIHVGSVATFNADFFTLNDKYYGGRALDNRMGGVMIAQVARMLKENKVKLPYSLYVVNAVMEEVGLRGAQMIVDTIRPNVAIITDVTHDTSTPHISSKKHGDVKAGYGPEVSFGPAVHNGLLDILIDTAKQNDIPIQYAAASRSTGTDTDAFAFSVGGVPSALISLPLRYMHTTVEMVHTADVEACINLMYHSLQNISGGHDFRYIKTPK